MFLQLKRIKPMRGTPLHKLSEIGYAAVDLSSERFTPGEQRLTMYKKPVDFTRDPAKMKVSHVDSAASIVVVVVCSSSGSSGVL
mmetsp:Transcript_2543/g.4775  ORF Transcript_2543/g.4775 Transcript_2543/m.4775 type:complete len:84 (+) Transcript_2543:654-905(+)